MYEGRDKSYQKRPAVMSDEVVGRTAQYLGEYAFSHAMREMGIFFHGGEPLLRPPEFFDNAVPLLRNPAAAFTNVSFNVQTNGTRLSREYLDVFAAHNVSVSVSLDGGKEANDRHRLYRRGASSFDRAAAGVALLNSAPEYRNLFSGMLCVIDTSNDPIEVYKDLCQFGPPSIDFLLPLGNWTTLPPNRSANPNETPYGDWLVKLFDHWAQQPDGPDTPGIRYFDEIIKLLVEGKSGLETLGAVPANIVIDSDGSLQLLDGLKTTAPGMPELDYSLTSPGDPYELEHRMSERMRVLGITTLGAECQVCPIEPVCRGGYYPHRYDESSSVPFMNRSIFGPDIYELVTHIQSAMGIEMPEPVQ